jgi:hypothetical protein
LNLTANGNEGEQVKRSWQSEKRTEEKGRQLERRDEIRYRY